MSEFLDELHRRLAATVPEGRFAACRFHLQIELFDTEEQAVRRLNGMPARERAGLVDLETGATRCAKHNFRTVIQAVTKAGLGPEPFRRIGRLLVGGRLVEPED